MGEVYEAVHAESGARCALKVLAAQHVDSLPRRAALVAEVRAMARLSHPNIVTVYDTGREVGTTWLAMELVAGGHLKATGSALDWTRLRELLLQLLDALAHAHARGVIHRDIKPGNVLVDRITGRAKLVDFGLAHAVGDRARGVIEGTPHYMAPEQITGEWREFGPWTDLYSLGCLAWSLVAGRPVWSDAQTTAAILQAHLQRLPEPLVLPPGIPPGLTGWIRRLLAKRPAERFTRAADAALALRAIEDAPGDGCAPTSSAAEAPDLSMTMSLLGFGESLDITRSVRAVGHPTRREGVGSGGASIPPIPADWRRPATGIDDDLAVLGVGAGLFGLRTLEVVGRGQEQDTLWAELVATVSERRPRALLLRGPSGVGKSRLATWLGERAHELGTASTLELSFDEGDDLWSPVARMLAAHLRVDGMPAGPALDRVESLLRRGGSHDVVHARGLLELCEPALRSGLDRTGALGSRGERFEALRRELLRTSRERPLVLCVDDLQWGGQACDLIRHILGRGEGAILVIATLEDGPVDGCLQRLAADPRCASLDVGPLSEHQMGSLARRLLELERSLAADVATWSGGFPLFGVQIVGAWLQAGALEATPSGYVLNGAALTGVAPDSIWRRRVHGFCRSRPVADLHALEIAALLGSGGVAEWQSACQLAGVAPSQDLVDAALRSGLALTSGRHGWQFAHGVLAQTLRTSAKESGRLPALSRACARALLERGAQVDPVRLCTLLTEGGRWSDALAHALVAGVGCGSDGKVTSGLRLLNIVDDLADQLGLPPEDPQRLLAVARRSHIVRRAGDPDRAVVLASEGFGLWREALGRRVRVELALALAQGRMRQGRWDDARELLASVQGDVAACDEVPELSQWFSTVRAEALRQGGQTADAGELLERALLWPPAPCWLRWRAEVHRGLFEVRRLEADFVAAEHHMAQASAIFAHDGFLGGLARSLQDRATLALQRGELDGATRLASEASALAREVGRTMPVPVLVAATVRLRQGRLDESRVQFAEVARGWSGGSAYVEAYARAGLCGVLLRQGDLIDGEAQLEQLEGIVQRTGLREWEPSVLCRLAAGDAPGELESRLIRLADALDPRSA